MSQVALGQQPGVAGVAGPLEPVDGERVEWVDGRNLVDHQRPPADPGHANELDDDELRSRHVMKRAKRPREIELAVRERQLGCIGLDERRVLRRTLACEGEQLRHPVDADDLPHQRCKCQRERARSTADVESALGAARKDECSYLLGELVCALVLTRDEARGSSGEAVLSHRRRLSVPAPGRSRSGRRART